MKKIIVIASCILAFAACNKTPQNGTAPEGSTALRDAVLRITPVMTKATETAFENGDAIGLTVSRESGAYATNKKLTYNGLEFSSDLLWYAEGTDPATLSLLSLCRCRSDILYRRHGPERVFGRFGLYRRSQG